MGLVKRVPVFQADGTHNPMKGDIQRANKGKLHKEVPSFQANSGKSLIGDVHVGSKTTKAKSRGMKDVQRIKQKAGLTNKGYGI